MNKTICYSDVMLNISIILVPIVGNNPFLFAIAAYIAAWMIDYCNLIGRKVVFETSETCFWGCFTLFSQWIRTIEILYPQWSSPIFYPATKVQNSVMFSPIVSTKCKIFSLILYADQKRNIQLKLFSFLPLCLTWLYCPCI